MFVFLFSLTISRAFSLHLRPSGRLWGWNAAGGLGKLGRHECLAGRRPCPLDGNSLQGYSQPSPKSGWAGSTGKTASGEEEDQQHRPMPSTGGRAGSAASAWLDIWHRKPGRRWSSAAVVLPPASAGTTAEAAATAITPTETKKVKVSKWQPKPWNRHSSTLKVIIIFLKIYPPVLYIKYSVVF